MYVVLTHICDPDVTWLTTKVFFKQMKITCMCEGCDK